MSLFFYSRKGYEGIKYHCMESNDVLWEGSYKNRNEEIIFFSYFFGDSLWFVLVSKCIA
jgi:hypothetical protein